MLFRALLGLNLVELRFTMVNLFVMEPLWISFIPPQRMYPVDQLGVWIMSWNWFSRALLCLNLVELSFTLVNLFIEGLLWISFVSPYMYPVDQLELEFWVGTGFLSSARSEPSRAQVRSVSLLFLLIAPCRHRLQSRFSPRTWCLALERGCCIDLERVLVRAERFLAVCGRWRGCFTTSPSCPSCPHFLVILYIQRPWEVSAGQQKQKQTKKEKKTKIKSTARALRPHSGFRPFHPPLPDLSACPFSLHWPPLSSLVFTRSAASTSLLASNTWIALKYLSKLSLTSTFNVKVHSIIVFCCWIHCTVLGDSFVSSRLFSFQWKCLCTFKGLNWSTLSFVPWLIVNYRSFRRARSFFRPIDWTMEFERFEGDTEKKMIWFNS